MSPEAALAIGLASGPHCLAMCGGIAAAFGARRVIPIVPLGTAGAAATDISRLVAFNTGRIAAYGIAGAVVGALGAVGGYLAGSVAWQSALLVAANLLLVLAGLSLAGASGAIGRVEALGAPLWRRIQPFAARALETPSHAAAVAAGSLWGWLPCGLVYTALAGAAVSGGAAQGAQWMLAFGLGTLPWLLAAGFAGGRLRVHAASRPVRVVAGVLLLSYGVSGLLRLPGITERLGGLAALCLPG
jgi:sulfite exporter TauE/SafE